MKIAFFIGSLGTGGAERVISNLANHYAEKQWDVDIVILLHNDVGYRLNGKINIVDMTAKKMSYMKATLPWMAKIRKYVKVKKPDRIVSFVGRINALVLTATLGMKVPILVSERSDPLRDGRGKSMLQFCNLIYQRASAVVFQTRYQQSCFSSRLTKRSHIIPNPVSVSVDNDITESEYEISTAGRLDEFKNHAMLIDAIALVAKKHPEVQCMIYGEGEQRRNLEKKIKEYGLGNNVQLPGIKTDIHKWIARSSIFVMTSEYEGLSNALVEAMMLGKACITTDYPGANEVIENDVTGIVVPRGNYKRLADEIGKLLDSKNNRKRLSEKAKEASARYQSIKVIKQWEELIQ